MTARLPSPLLRIQAPRRVLDGFGRSVVASCRFAAPRTVDELSDVVAKARRECLTVTFRGSGRSYGDASLNAAGLVVDTTALDRVERWEPSTGIIEAGPGMTIEGLWRRTIEDGYWPHVVPGTITAADTQANAAAHGGTATYTTVQGEPLMFQQSGSGWVVIDSKGNRANITIANVMQSNGVIHVIDSVLMP